MKDYSYLLNRQEHVFRESQIDEALAGRRVLVTGAGGTIGSAIVRRVLKSPANFVGLVGHSELPIFNLLHSLSSEGHAIHMARIDKKIADVGDCPVIERLIDQWEPDIVFHAAAHKHVGLMEAQPAEAFQNNVEATVNLARIAIASGSVRKFVFISTDKAARPTSVMGASKRFAEVALQENFSPFVTSCRFGNVLGSSGSLIEIVERRLAKSEPVIITNPAMRRFFITAKEAVGLVLTAGLLEEGTCFSLEMGELVSIMHVLAKLCPTDTKFEFGSPGAGEKIEEVILGIGEYFIPTDTAAVKRIWTPESRGINAAIARVRHNPNCIVQEAQAL